MKTKLIKNKLLICTLAVSLFNITSCNNTNNSSNLSDGSSSINSSTEDSNKEKVLVCYYGDERTAYSGEIIEKAVKNVNDSYTIDTLALGLTNTNYDTKLSNMVDSNNYKAVIIIGEYSLRFCDKTIKSRQGINFFAIDSYTEKSYKNLHYVDFDFEEISYLSGLLALNDQNDSNIAYLSSIKNKFSLKENYGFLQAVDDMNFNHQVSIKYFEENGNYEKTVDYITQYKDNNYSNFFSNDLSTVKYINSKLSSTDSFTCTSPLNSQDYNRITHSIKKSYANAINKVLDVINQDEIDTRYTLDYETGGYEVENIDSLLPEVQAKINDLSRVKEFDETDFEALKNKYVVNENDLYSPKYSVYSMYHEAIPNCDDANDWKYAPRPGADGGLKPSSWKSVSVWSTIYQQDGFTAASNTGIEFKNMFIYGYSPTKGWVELEHANPVGAFYNENFTNDSHIDFSSNFFNAKDTKTTKIKLDNKTKGYNYHPFGTQLDLEALDMLDIKYVLTKMDIRLIVWDKTKTNDMNSAKYVANIGADWWVKPNATWNADWSSNRDVCVGQFRTITEEWKTLYMCSIPLNEYDQLMGSENFYKN